MADRQHEWTEWAAFTACRKCGIVRRADDQNKACRGPVCVAHKIDPFADDVPDRPTDAALTERGAEIYKRRLEDYAVLAMKFEAARKRGGE